jgi:hypothetical protein
LEALPEGIAGVDNGVGPSPLFTGPCSGLYYAYIKKSDPAVAMNEPHSLGRVDDNVEDRGNQRS